MGSSVDTQSSDSTNQDEILVGVCCGHPYSLGLGCFNDAGESVPCAGRKRREAEAEADPAYLLAGYPYAYLHPYTAGFGCHNVAGLPVPCAAGKKKRSADPEADPALLYGYGYPYAYGYVHPYTAGLGCHNVAGVPVPCGK